MVVERVSWVLDADIRRFFDSVDHGWLMRMLEHRIADPRVLLLLRQWLAAGVLENGIYAETVEGTPQGSGITPRTQKQTSAIRRVMGPAGNWRAAVRRGRQSDRNAMPDDDRVVADEDVLDDQPHDSLALIDVKRVGGSCAGDRGTLRAFRQGAETRHDR